MRYQIGNEMGLDLDELRRRLPRVSFPADGVIDLPGVMMYHPVEPPEHDPLREMLRELPPVDGVQRWKVIPMPEEDAAAALAAWQEALRNAVVEEAAQRLDSFAQQRGYDGIVSLCTYASSDHPRFGPEGRRGVALRDQVWETLYAYLDGVEAGDAAMPDSVEAAVAILPALTWGNAQ